MQLRPSEQHVAIPQAVQDVCAIAVQAHRAGCGDIVWAGWAPGEPGDEVRDETRFGFGSQFIMLSKEGAACMLTGMQNADELGSTRGHWDMDLRWFLALKGPEARASYVVPGVGSFTTHVSHCDTRRAAGWVRPSGWTEQWVCPGTRRSEDPRGRQKWLASFERKGRCKCLARLDDEPTTADHRWLSHWAMAQPMPSWAVAPPDADAWLADPRALRPPERGEGHSCVCVCFFFERERKGDARVQEERRKIGQGGCT